jgi:hypothetical protein
MSCRYDSNDFWLRSCFVVSRLSSYLLHSLEREMSNVKDMLLYSIVYCE